MTVRLEDDGAGALTIGNAIGWGHSASSASAPTDSW
jgi:hypothetical protein